MRAVLVHNSGDECDGDGGRVMTTIVIMVGGNAARVACNWDQSVRDAVGAACPISRARQRYPLQAVIVSLMPQASPRTVCL